MAEVILTPGTLAEPACGYANEQARHEAFTEAIVATLLGGIEWQASVDQPTDLTLHWLKLDADGRPVAILEYSDADARYVRTLNIPAVDGSAGGAGNAYTLTFTPAFTTATANQAQRRFTFTANHTNTGAATLDVDGLGAVPIVKHAGAAVVAGDIRSGQVVDVVISAGNAWLQTPVEPPATSAATLRALFSTSSEFSIPPAGGTQSIANPAAAQPVMLRVVAVCKAGVDGYSIGDEIGIEGIGADFDASEVDNPAYTVSADATNITVAAVIAGNGQTYAAKGGGNADWAVAVSGNNWMFKAYVL